MIRFKKIKVVKTDSGKDKLHIEWERKVGEEWDQAQITSSDKPLPSFHTTLQALAQDVVEMCELPTDYRERIMVKGVSFSYGGEKETMGATLTAAMHLKDSNVPLNLNTPHKAEEFYSEDGGDPKQLLDDRCVERLYQMIDQAQKFIDGDRQQIGLFNGKAA